MTTFYKGTGNRPETEVAIHSELFTEEMLKAQSDPAGYRLQDGENSDRVVRAVNVALLLRLPLLISGEPGSGKTQLGFAVAHELGKPKAFKYSVKSTSTARDLFYEYDAVSHFRAAQIAAAQAAALAAQGSGGRPAETRRGGDDVRDFIDYTALGLAILLALPLEDRIPFLSPAIVAGTDKGAGERAEIVRMLRSDRPQQTVVIIDEVDKAPRDFPNDLLHEIETMSFRVAELGGRETPPVPPELRPIVFITSNSERQLPEAFLRRCAFVHLAYPQGQALKAILWSRLKKMYDKDSVLLLDACEFYEDLRDREVLDKPPGTAELIQFLQAAKIQDADPRRAIADQRERLVRAAPLLAKVGDDTDRLVAALEAWNPKSRRA